MTLVIYEKKAFKKLVYRGVKSIIHNKSTLGLGMFDGSSDQVPYSRIRKVVIKDV